MAVSQREVSDVDVVRVAGQVGRVDVLTGTDAGLRGTQQFKGFAGLALP